MSLTTKLLVGTAAGAGLVAGYSYLRNLQRAQVQLEVSPKAYLHKLDWNGLTIRVDALLKNPTRASFSIKFPYIRVDYGEVMLGSSQVVNKDIRIPSYGQVMIESMMVQIPVISFFSVAANVLKDVQSNKPVKLLAKVITTLDLGLTNMPYESKSEIILKK